MMPPPAPLPPPDDDPWDEFDTAPAAVVAPPMPGPPTQVAGAVAPGLPVPPTAAAMPAPPAAAAMPMPSPTPPAESMVPVVETAVPAAVQPVPAAAVQPMTTNLGGQQVMMQAGMMPAQGATVVQVPVPVAKEPREWPPMTHMIVMTGFGLLLFTAILVLFANLADPPSALDFPTDDDATFEELQQAAEDLVLAEDKYDRRQAVYGAFSLFFGTVGQLTLVAGLLLYTVKDGEDMPASVRAVLFGGVLLFLIRMLTNGLDLAALL